LAVLLIIEAAALGGCRPIVMIPNLSVCEDHVIFGSAEVADGTFWVWSYDANADKFQVLIAGLEGDSARLVPGSTPSTAICRVSRLKEDAGTYFYAAGHDAHAPLLLKNFVGYGPPGPLWTEGDHREDIGMIRGTDYLLVDRVVQGQWTRSYELWDIRQSTLAGSLLTQADEADTRLDFMPRFVSHAFGPDTNLFLVAESDIMGGYGGNHLIRVLSIEPFRELDRLVASGRLYKFGPCPVPDEVIVIEYRPIYRVMKLVCSGQDEELHFELKTIETLSEPGPDCRVVEWRNGLTFVSTSRPQRVRVARRSDSDGTEVVTVSFKIAQNPLDFVVNDSGTLLVTRDGPNRFSLWSVDFPQVNRTRSCQLVYEYDSRELKLVSQDVHDTDP